MSADSGALSSLTGLWDHRSRDAPAVYEKQLLTGQAGSSRLLSSGHLGRRIRTRRGQERGRQRRARFRLDCRRGS